VIAQQVFQRGQEGDHRDPLICPDRDNPQHFVEEVAALRYVSGDAQRPGAQA
jgi:hypothetical protein